MKYGKVWEVRDKPWCSFGYCTGPRAIHFLLRTPQLQKCTAIQVQFWMTMFCTIRGKFSWNTACTPSYWKQMHVHWHHQHQGDGHAEVQGGSNISDYTENKMGSAKSKYGKWMKNCKIFTQKTWRPLERCKCTWLDNNEIEVKQGVRNDTDSFGSWYGHEADVVTALRFHTRGKLLE